MYTAYEGPLMVPAWRSSLPLFKVLRNSLGLPKRSVPIHRMYVGLPDVLIHMQNGRASEDGENLVDLSDEGYEGGA